MGKEELTKILEAEIPIGSESEAQKMISVLKPDLGWAIEERDQLTLVRLFFSENSFKKWVEKIETIVKKKSGVIKIVEPWEEVFRKTFKGIEVGPFFVRPPWIKPKTDKVDIIIYPASGFGTGDHESTQGMLLAIEKLKDKRFKKVIDVGTGSGILAIAVSKLGIADKILAIDISDLAIENAIKNLRLNNIKNTLIYLGSLDSINTNYKFDLVLANLDYITLKKLRTKLVDLTEKNGNLIISGFTKKSRDLIEHFAHNINLIEVITIENWLTAIYTK